MVGGHPLLHPVKSLAQPVLGTRWVVSPLRKSHEVQVKVKRKNEERREESSKLNMVQRSWVDMSLAEQARVSKL